MPLEAGLVAILLGVLWHTAIGVYKQAAIGDILSWNVLAGASAGLCAGYLTWRSRQRHGGAERFFDGVITYYAAAITYSVGLAVVDLLTGMSISARRVGIDRALDLAVAAVAACWYVVVVASVFGILLIPLCLVTRHVFWRVSSTALRHRRQPRVP